MNHESQLGRSVKHASGAQLTGIITAVFIRSYGVSYGVTWSDLAERCHTPSELIDADKPAPTISMLPPPSKPSTAHQLA